MWKAYPNILNDRNTHPPFPSSNPVKNSQYTDVSLYIFWYVFSVSKKQLQAGTRKSCRKSVHPWKLKGQASTNENISKIWDMVNTSTLSNHDKYKYFTVYFLIPAYSFNPKAAFWAVLENRTWKNGPRTETESAPEGTPSPIFLFLLHHWISIIY